MKTRIPMQVSDKFEKKLKELQKKIRMTTGNDRSLRDLTEDLVATGLFEDVEKKLLKKDINGIDLRIKFDGRMF